MKDVATRISELYKIPVLLDQRALDEAGLGVDTPNTLHLENVTLARALKQLLDPLDLSYAAVDGLLLITTRTHLEEELANTVYPVGDLLEVKVGAKGQAIADALEDLADAITSTVQPNSWDQVGGTGTVVPFASRGVLVCLQSQPVQNEVAALLAKMRLAPRVGGPGPSVTEERRSRVVTQVHLITAPAEEAKEIVEVVTRLVEPKSWKEPDVYIKLLPGKLVVRHRSEVQRKISRLLENLGLVNSSGWPVGGSGGGGFF